MPCQDVEAGTVFVNRCDYPSPVSLPSLRRKILRSDQLLRILLGLAGRNRARAKHLANLASTSLSS